MPSATSDEFELLCCFRKSHKWILKSGRFKCTNCAPVYWTLYVVNIFNLSSHQKGSRIHPSSLIMNFTEFNKLTYSNLVQTHIDDNRQMKRRKHCNMGNRKREKGRVGAIFCFATLNNERDKNCGKEFGSFLYFS